MPIYEYRCDKCDNDFETLVLGSDEVCCPKCGGPVDRLMSCCSFKSGAGDFKSTAVSGKSSCGSCSASSCASCH